MDNDICLTCLCKPNKFHNLNEVLLENLKIFEMLHQLVPVAVEQQVSTLPDRICVKCLKKLLISYKFQKQCLNSLHNLHKTLSEYSSKKESQQNLSHTKLQAEEVEFKSNECNSIDENTMESVPEIKEDLQMSFDEIGVKCFVANKDEDNYKAGDNCLRQKEDAEDTLKVKLQCNKNIHKSLHEKNLSEEVEEGSANLNQCKICNKIFKQHQGLASHMSKTHLKKHLYQCKKCDKGFSVEELFIRHCHRHLGIKPFPCTQCDKAFDTNSSLNQHLLCHSKESSYSCTICVKQFQRIDVLKQHMLRHDDGELFQCTKCAKSFKSFSDHIKHITSHKNEDKICDKPTSNEENLCSEQQLLKCDHYDKEFIPYKNLKLHRKSHYRKNGYQCQFCSNTFSEGNNLKNHTRHLHKKSNEKLEREILVGALNRSKVEPELSCKEDLAELPFENSESSGISEFHQRMGYVEKNDLKLEKNQNGTKQKTIVTPKVDSNHIHDDETKSMVSTESMQCNLCNQVFKNPQGLSIHKSRTHFRNHLYQCDKCDRGFSVEEFYIKHRNRHLGIKSFKCNQCGKAFETNSVLNQHLISHSKLTPHLCTTCGKSFRRLDGLRQHMLRHGEERPFKCSICPKSFKCLSDKLKHMIIHDEKKRYECNLCGARLASSESLSQHQMTHTGEKPFKCSYCEKSFISLSNMKCHERIHTGEKPYKCQYCWKTFRQSNDRNKHTTRMHKFELGKTKIEQIEKN